MHLLRRILTGLVMATLALLPGASHALSATGGEPVAMHDHASVRMAPARVAIAAHEHHAGHEHRAGHEPCAEHRLHDRDAPPCRPPCKSCAMACCAPAIVGLAAPLPARARRTTLARRSRPSTDRRYADVSAAERLRPPIPL